VNGCDYPGEKIKRFQGGGGTRLFAEETVEEEARKPREENKGRRLVGFSQNRRSSLFLDEDDNPALAVESLDI